MTSLYWVSLVWIDYVFPKYIRSPQPGGKIICEIYTKIYDKIMIIIEPIAIAGKLMYAIL
ncbi:MAG: hypothetical protein U7126_06695 [Microcoleus sp.]